MTLLGSHRQGSAGHAIGAQWEDSCDYLVKGCVSLPVVYLRVCWIGVGGNASCLVVAFFLPFRGIVSGIPETVVRIEGRCFLGIFSSVLRSLSVP